MKLRIALIIGSAGYLISIALLTAYFQGEFKNRFWRNLGWSVVLSTFPPFCVLRILAVWAASLKAHFRTHKESG